MFAIWLLPDEKDTRFLEAIINNLSQEFNSPKFLPHITAYGLVDIDLTIVEDAVENSIDEIKPFIVKKSGIGYSDDIWKSLFINIASNNELDLINSKLSYILGRYVQYKFSPHISLMYKNMEKMEKIKILESLRIKNEFEINKIAIQKFSKKIHEWKIIRVYDL